MRRQRIFSTCWLAFGVFATAGAAVKSYTDGMRILGPLCALVAVYAKIALAVCFVPRIGQAPAASLMRRSFPYISLGCVAGAVSLSDGGLSLAGLITPFSLYLFFVSNQRFINWLEEEPSHDNT